MKVQLRKMQTGRSWALIAKDQIGDGDGKGYLAWRFLLRFDTEWEITEFVKDVVGERFSFGDLERREHGRLSWEGVVATPKKAYIARVTVGTAEDLRAIAWGSPGDVQALLEAMQ